MKLVAVILFLAVPVVAADCPKGCEPHQGVCACDQAPEIAPSFQPMSDEKPPKNQIPAWQLGEVKADMPKSLAAEDEKLDKSRVDADTAGKMEAGVYAR